MTAKGLETLLRRDRAIVAAALVAIVLLAWIYLWQFAGRPMGGGMGHGATMDMSHAGEMANAALSTGFNAWSGADFLLMALMWAVMMVGMMIPSAAPMILIYARVARHANERGNAFASSGWFASGYLLAWTGFALLATSLQWLLEASAMMTPAMRISDTRLAGSLLIAAGIYQLTPLKRACLGRCRSPMHFIQDHGGFRPERRASVLLGVKHGAFCIGCCWALMILLFLGGVMNLTWVALLALLLLAEKLLPIGLILSRAVGLIFVLAGAGLLAGLIPAWT